MTAVAHGIVRGQDGRSRTRVAGLRVVAGVLGRTDLVRVGVMPRLEHRVADVAGNGLARAVEAAFPHPVPQLAHTGTRRVEVDGGGLGDRVRVDGQHPGPTGQHGLGDVLAGRPVDTGDFEDGDRTGVTPRVLVVLVVVVVVFVGLTGMLVRGQGPASIWGMSVMVES